MKTQTQPSLGVGISKISIARVCMRHDYC